MYAPDEGLGLVHQAHGGGGAGPDWPKLPQGPFTASVWQLAMTAVRGL